MPNTLDTVSTACDCIYMTTTRSHEERCIIHATLVAWDNGAESEEQAREWALMALVEPESCTCD